MSYLSKKSFTMRQVVGLLTIVFLGITVIAYAVTVDFTPGTTISSTAVENSINQNKSVATCSTAANSALAFAPPYTDIRTVSITVPGPGSILVLGSGFFGLTRVGASSWTSGVSISDTSGIFNGDAENYWAGPAGMPTGIYYAPFHEQYAFTVAGAGTYTYYLVGWRSSTESVFAAESKICAIFTPS